MSLFRLIALLVVALCCEHFLSQANAQVKAPKPSGGSVSGTVTIKGKPAAGVTVSARAGANFSPFDPQIRVKTDQDGKYRMADMPPGSYRVTVLAPGFVPPTSTFRNETVVVRENETAEGIDFALVRGGVITGKVVEANGKPVIEQYIQILAVGRSPETFPAQRVSVLTDDRGIYRMFGVAPGSYKVCVGTEGDGLATASTGQPSYKRTFHPAVTDESEAAIIEVSEGSEAKNIDIVVDPPRPNFTVSGTVVEGESGKRVMNTKLMLSALSSKEGRPIISRTVPANSKGEFRLEFLPPGRYAISVSTFNSDALSDTVKFEVVDQDIDGLVIKTLKGASISGTVVLENVTDPAVWTKLSKLSVQLFVNTSQDQGYSKVSPIGPDGTFRFGGLQEGQANLTLGTALPFDRAELTGFLVSRVERNDVVQPPYVDLKSGEQLDGFKVVVAYGNGVVRGTVKPASGSFPANARIFVRINSPGDRSNRIRSPQVDPHGNFIIEGLPAGTYDITAGVPPADRSQPVLTRQQINVSENGTLDLTLTVDLDAKPGTPQ